MRGRSPGRIVPVLALVLLSGPGAARGGESSALHASFDRGVERYGSGDYEGAVEAFNDVLSAGIDDSAVHYNLGNAWFKAGRLGRAIYHYRRAHALAPRDEDIAANLEYARFLALDRLEEEAARTDLPVEGWLDRVTPEEASRLVSVLGILAGVVGCAWQLSTRRWLAWRRSFVVMFGLWAVCFTVAWTVDRRAARVHEAVVLPREAEVRNGPGESFETAFVLHEGAEVVVEGERGNWTEISLPGDLRGWILSDGIARL